MSNMQHSAEPPTPFRTNTYQPDPAFDPHPLMRVAEKLTGLDQAKIGWRKCTPYRLTCMRRAITSDSKSRNSWMLTSLLLAGVWLAMAYTQHGLPSYGSDPIRWTATRLLTLVTVAWVVYAAIRDYRKSVAQFFSREYRWTENGPGTRFLIRELRGRFLKLIPHLRLNKDWKGATQNGPEIEAARSALGDWISWLMALTHPHINLCLPLPQSGASAVHLSQDLLQLLQTLEELNSPPLDTPSWRLSNLDAVAIQLRLKLALVQPLLEALIGPPKYLIPWRRHPLA